MPSVTLPPFIVDILSQPRVLRAGLRGGIDVDMKAVITSIHSHQRVVLTGMGASLAALLPAWRSLARSGLPVWHLDTAELLSLGPGFPGRGTLVIAASQSGRSAELVTLAERLGDPTALIAVTNYPGSPLGQAASQVIPINSEEEHAVSTRSFINTLALASLMAAAVDSVRVIDSWERAADAMEEYLNSWRARVDALKELIGLPERLALLARGTSLAAANYGGLIAKEAAKWPVEAMPAAQFRHGPLEMADERLTALILAGDEPVARQRNLQLAHDIGRLGGRSFWIDSESASGLLPIEIPAIAGPARISVEILPLQLLCVALAELIGIEPGKFRHLQKVTTVE